MIPKHVPIMTISADFGICPKCNNDELHKFCLFPYRVTGCPCGWDDLEEQVKRERASLLDHLKTIPRDKLIAGGWSEEDIDRGLKNLADLEHERMFIETVRSPRKT